MKPVSAAIIHQIEVLDKVEYFDTNNPHPGETLLKVLDYCFAHDLDVPGWAKQAYRQSYKKYGQRIGKEPLITAFDTDPDAGKHKESKRRKNHYFNAVYHTLAYLHLAEKWPIDEALFSEIARRINKKGMGASTIKSWYYQDIKPIGFIFSYNLSFVLKD